MYKHTDRQTFCYFYIRKKKNIALTLIPFKNLSLKQLDVLSLNNSLYYSVMTKLLGWNNLYFYPVDLVDKAQSDMKQIPYSKQK